MFIHNPLDKELSCAVDGELIVLAPLSVTEVSDVAKARQLLYKWQFLTEVTPEEQPEKVEVLEETKVEETLGEAEVEAPKAPEAEVEAPKAPKKPGRRSSRSK